jgi:tetratricopeptide (TPR) repeat protein
VSQHEEPDDRGDAPGPEEGVPVGPAAPGLLAPAGDAYDWFRRGSALLDSGNAGAAAELLSWAVAAEPEAASIREAYARALFDARRFVDAEREFRALVYLAPDDDYARFGLGMALWRLRQFPEAAEHLAMAAVMRPERSEYGAALKQVRATIAARAEAGLDPVGSPDEGFPSVEGLT